MESPLPPIFSRLVFLCIVLAGSGRAEGPAKLSFDELLHLAVDETPPPGTVAHLRRLLSEPFISNEATLSGMRPVRPIDRNQRPVLRAVEWNIARGVNLPEIQMSLSPSGDFLGAKKLDRIQQELAVLRDADVVILDEVDSA